MRTKSQENTKLTRDSSKDRLKIQSNIGEKYLKIIQWAYAKSS